jgi:hypothetical protein
MVSPGPSGCLSGSRRFNPRTLVRHPHRFNSLWVQLDGSNLHIFNINC